RCARDRDRRRPLDAAANPPLTPRKDAPDSFARTPFDERTELMTAISARVLGEATVQELREAVRGDVLTPVDTEYEEARRVWTGAHDGRPAIIVRCAGTADVIAAVGFARSNDLPIAVRGGGHSLPGFSTVDDGIVIDLSPMNQVHVDPATR